MATSRLPASAQASGWPGQSQGGWLGRHAAERRTGRWSWRARDDPGAACAGRRVRCRGAGGARIGSAPRDPRGKVPAAADPPLERAEAGRAAARRGIDRGTCQRLVLRPQGPAALGDLRVPARHGPSVRGRVDAAGRRRVHDGRAFGNGARRAASQRRRDHRAQPGHLLRRAQRSGRGAGDRPGRAAACPQHVAVLPVRTRCRRPGFWRRITARDAAPGNLGPCWENPCRRSPRPAPRCSSGKADSASSQRSSKGRYQRLPSTGMRASG